MIHTALTVFLRIGWFVVCGFSAVATLFLFAFADSPALAQTMGKVFHPILYGALVVYILGAYLILFHTQSWVLVVLAFVLAIAPFLATIFAMKSAS